MSEWSHRPECLGPLESCACVEEIVSQRDEARRERDELVWLISNSGRCSFCGKTMLQEESAAHMLACEKHPLAEARRERDMFKAECASISAEFGLPPTIRPAEGEITRMRKELKESRAALEGMRAKLERYEEMLDVLRCWFLLPAEPAEGAHRDWARQIEDLFALNTEGVSREPNPAEAERTGGRNTPGSES